MESSALPLDLEVQTQTRTDDDSFFITSDKAELEGIVSTCGPAPEPVECEFCGKKLFYKGWLFHGFPGESRRIIRWSEPERCNCPDARKKWAEFDAEKERQRLERIAAEEQKRHRQEVERLLSSSGIGKRFRQRTFDHFKQDTPGRKRAYKAAHEYAENFDAMRNIGEGLYIEGGNGTGKTHIAAAIALYLTEKEYSVVMKTSFDLLEEIRRTFDESDKTEAQVLSVYKQCDLLIIDDLGKEQCTDWSMSILYSIINDRYEAMRPMIITTNFGSRDLIHTLTPKGYGSQKIEAIISRLREVCKSITMDWEDYRGQKGQK